MSAPDTTPSRRTLFTAAGAAIIGAETLAACGGAADSIKSSAQGAATQAAGAAQSAAQGVANEAAGTLTDVPVGTAVGKTVAGQAVILAQPKAGNVVAFSAICPHKDCVVKVAPENKLVCPCHGSTFDAFTGKVEKGPATSNLKSLSVSVTGDGINIS